MGIRIWKFLTTDIRDLNWGRGEQAVKTGSDAAKAVLDLAKAAHEQKTLNPYVEQISSLLDVLNRSIDSHCG